MKSVTGAQGIEDDLVFLRVFEIILNRLVPEDEDELIAKAAMTDDSLQPRETADAAIFFKQSLFGYQGAKFQHKQRALGPYDWKT